MFHEKEVAFILSQRLARLATVSPDMQPDVVSVGFEFDGANFFIGGRDPASTRRHKNILTGSNRVALILDDLQSVDPWRPRGLRIYGTAQVVEREGYAGRGVYHFITPAVSWSWGIVGEPFVDGHFRPHKIIHGQ